MAQTGTTVITLESAPSMSPRVLKLAWTATAGGAVTTDVTDTTMTGRELLYGHGVLTAFGFLCAVGVSAAYDMAITDARGMDLIYGLGANLTGGGTAQWFLNTAAQVLAAPVSGPISVAITNAGNATTGTIYLYIR